MVRSYTPEIVAGVIDRVAATVEPREAEIFRACYLNTLDTTIENLADGTAFVVTGDIPAMWLRDSTTQLTPYLHIADQDPVLADTIAGVVRRQFEFLLIDPYANAFNKEPSGNGHTSDRTEMSAWVWERKFELDSLCYPVQLAHDFWRITGRTDHLDRLGAVARAVIDVLRTEQNHDELSPYRFERFDGAASDTLERGGLGPDVAVTGLVWAGFRPSDDACTLGYNVPGNILVALALRQLSELAREVLDDGDLAADADALRAEVEQAIVDHAVVEVAGERVYAYEVDGRGAALVMDDANVPSLLALPLLGWCDSDDPLYAATRRVILSEANPFYVEGTAAQGIGSPHTPEGWVWPIALAVQGLTSDSHDEKRALLATLAATDADTGMMHESFDPNEPQQFTRPWFSWANAMYCELALDVAGLRTHQRVAQEKVSAE